MVDQNDPSKSDGFTQQISIYGIPEGREPSDVWGKYDSSDHAAPPSISIVDRQRLRLGFGTGDGYVTVETDEDVLAPNSWNRIVASFDGSTYMLEVGQVTVLEESVSGTPETIVPEEFGGGFSGKFANATLTNNAGETVSHWPMNDGHGTKIHDSEGSNDGTISGGRWVPDSRSPDDASRTGMAKTYVDQRGLVFQAGLMDPKASYHPDPDGPKASDFGNLAAGSRPTLLDGNDSLVHAYYRTPDDKFMATQYDPMVRRDIYRARWTAGRGDDEGYAYFASKQPIPSIGDAISIAGNEDPTLDLTLTNGMPNEKRVEEHWRGVPNQVTEIASVLAGDAISDPTTPALQEGNGVFYDYSGDRRVGFHTVSDVDGEKLVFAASNVSGSRRARLVPKKVELKTGETATFAVDFEGASTGGDSKDGTVRLELDAVPTTSEGSDYRQLYSTFVDVINGRADQETYDYGQHARFGAGELYSLPAGPGALPVAVTGTTADALSVTDGTDPTTCDFTVELHDGKSHTWNDVPRRPDLFVDALDGAESVTKHLVFGEVPARGPNEQPTRLKNVSGDDVKSPRGLTDFFECIGDVGDVDPGDSSSGTLSISTFSIPMKRRQGVTTSANPRLYDQSATTATDVFRTTGSELYSFVSPDEPDVAFPAILTASVVRQIRQGMNGFWTPLSTQKSLSFGEGEELRIDDSDGELTRSGDLTIEAWTNFSIDDLVSRNPIVSARPAKDRGLYANDYAFGVGTDLRLVGAFNGRQYTSEKVDGLTDWSHVASVYESTYGVSLRGEEFADCGGADELQFKDELTVALRVQVRRDGTPNGVLLSKKTPDDPAGYELSVVSNRDGDSITLKPTFEVWLECEYDNGDTTYEQINISHTAEVRPGEPATIVARFDTPRELHANNQQPKPSVGISVWQGDNGHVPDPHDGDHYKSVTVATSETPVTLGARRTRPAGYEPGKPATENRFEGVVSDVALWEEALDLSVGKTISRLGLDAVAEKPVAVWRFDEQSGSIAADSEGGNDARFIATDQRELVEDNLWTPFPGYASFYANGDRLSVDTVTTVDTKRETPRTEARIASGWDETLVGKVDDVRVWNEARSVREIADNRYQKLTGRERSLGAYWPFDQVSGEAAVDATGNGNDALLPASGSEPSWDAPAPISSEARGVGNALGIASSIPTEQAPAVVEYADAHRTTSGQVTGMMNRAYVYSTDGELDSRPDFPVGTLEPKYIGQVQTEPTLVGFVEGPPPLPSENLTRPFYRLPFAGPYLSYDDSSSVSFTSSESTSVGLAGTHEYGFSRKLAIAAGVLGGSETEVGFAGISTRTIKTKKKFGVSVGADFSSSANRNQELSAGQTTTKTNKFTNGGDWERGEPYLAPPDADIDSPTRRYVPDNAGYALVKSRTADLYSFYLQETGSMVATQVVPDPDVPEDVNVIYFPMNPRYVKNGTLDGRVGTRRDPDYRHEDSQRGSYFKPVEAYGLEAEVNRENERLRGYYAEAFGGTPPDDRSLRSSVRLRRRPSDRLWRREPHLRLVERAREEEHRGHIRLVDGRRPVCRRAGRHCPD